MTAKRERVMVFKLYFGGSYLGRDGQSTNDIAQAAQFLHLDAYKFESAIRYTGHCRYNDHLWGMSMEFLPKHQKHTPLSAEEIAMLIAKTQLVRMLHEADRFDRLADGYLVQADHDRKMADNFRVKAAELRKKVSGEQAV